MSDETQSWQWFEKSQKPKDGQQVIVLMISPTGGDDLVKVKHSLYFDRPYLKGFGDAWKEQGLIDDELILLWTPYHPPLALQVSEALIKFDNKEQDNG